MQTVIAHGMHSAQGMQLRCSALARREGPCRGLAYAAPETAPGGLFVRESRYAEARTSTSAVVAAACVGGAISTSLSHVP